MAGSTGAGAAYMVWASVLAFACILVMLAILVAIPFCLTRMRRVPALDRMLTRLADSMGATPATQGQSRSQTKPAVRGVLQTLVTSQYHSNNDCEDPEPDHCPICFCEYEEGAPIIRLNCSHFYHQDCIIKWLQRTAACPMCKAELVSNTTAHEATAAAAPQAAAVHATAPAAVPAAGVPEHSAAPHSPALLWLQPASMALALQH
eukprot:GHRR01006430.1.p1 GENE.GHRR01006430.1~~GHRR01006430.1.p1  ORF type:complete len:205 (+),score=52.54 GHRR01006430.1:637-1251(+)